MKLWLTGFLRGRENRMAVLAMLLLVVAVACRQPLERSMALHMLLQLPMVIAVGILLAPVLSHLAGSHASRLALYDAHGVTGLLAFSLVTTYWMIPKALEHALIAPAAEAGKFLSLLLAGMLLPAALAHANRIIQLFFLGNLAAMMAIVGMLYQDAPQRLCNLYLRDEQTAAGIGLVFLAIAIPLLWGLHHFAAAAGERAAPVPDN